MRYSYNQAAFELLDLYRAKLSKTDDMDLREMKKWIRLHRAVWLRNEYNKNRTIDDAVEQDLGAIKMLEKTGNFISAGTGTTVLISALQLPTTVELWDVPAFTRIGPVSKLQYNYLPPINLTRIPFLANGRFTTNAIWSFQWNNYIGIICKGSNSIYTDILTNGLNVVGIFEDITHAARFPEVTDYAINPSTTFSLPSGSNKYFDDDSEAPIHDWMLEYMRQELIKSEGNISSQVTELNKKEDGRN